jgi:hypothetical protein
MKFAGRFPVSRCLLAATVLALFPGTATPGHAAPALVRGPYLQSATPDSIVVRWRTDTATDSRMQYGLTLGELEFAEADPALVTDHAVTLTDLAPDTKYYYAIGDAGGVLAGGADCHFTTPPSGNKPVRIWAIGDAGTASAGSFGVLAVRDAYAAFTGARPTDVWLMLGDNAYYSGTDAEYQAAVFDVFGSLLRTTPVWPTLGNHETYAPGPGGQLAYFDIFSLPQDGRAGGVPSGNERYYSFNYANVHFVCLDSEISDAGPEGAMQLWVEQDLAAATNDWIIAYWHSPPYSKGSHNSDTEGALITMRQQIVPLLETYGVDLVLCGHSHSYERSYLLHGHYGSSGTLQPSMLLDPGDGQPAGSGAYAKSPGGPGAVYIVAGSSGWTSGGALNHPAMFVGLNRLGSLVLDIDGDRLEAKFLRENGAVDDHFTIVKGDQPPVILTQPESQTATLGATVRFNVVVSGTRPMRYQWWHEGLALAGATNASLVVAGVQPSHAGRYFVTVINAISSALSDDAVLAITNGSCLVVAPAYATLNGGYGSSVLRDAIRLQEMYSASFFPDQPILIHELRFRPDAVTGQAFSATLASVQISLSTMPLVPGNLGYAFANNHGPDVTVVFNGGLSLSSAFLGPVNGPKDFDIIVPLQTPFLYDSARGHLLVDIQNFSGSTIPAVDSGDTTGIRRAFALGGSSTVATSLGSGADVLQLCYTTPQGPPLVIQLSPPNALLIWPVQGSAGYELEYATSLDQPVWNPVGLEPIPAGANWQVAVPLQAGPVYFRLKR